MRQAFDNEAKSVVVRDRRARESDGTSKGLVVVDGRRQSLDGAF